MRILAAPGCRPVPADGAAVPVAAVVPVDPQGFEQARSSRPGRPDRHRSDRGTVRVVADQAPGPAVRRGGGHRAPALGVNVEFGNDARCTATRSCDVVRVDDLDPRPQSSTASVRSRHSGVQGSSASQPLSVGVVGRPCRTGPRHPRCRRAAPRALDPTDRPAAARRTRRPDRRPVRRPSGSGPASSTRPTARICPSRRHTRTAAASSSAPRRQFHPRSPGWS